MVVTTRGMGKLIVRTATPWLCTVHVPAEAGAQLLGLLQLSTAPPAGACLPP